MRAHHSGRHGQSLPLSPRKNVRRTIILDSLPSLPDATLAPASVPALMRITNYPAPPPSRAEDQRPDANPRVSVSAEGRSRHFSRKTDPSLSRPCSALHCGRSIPTLPRYVSNPSRRGWRAKPAEAGKVREVKTVTIESRASPTLALPSPLKLATLGMRNRKRKTGQRRVPKKVDAL